MPVTLQPDAVDDPALRGAPRRTSARRSGRVPALPALALLAVLVLALLPSSDSAFVGTASDAGNALGAADYFTCAAAITAASPGVYYKLNETGTGSTATDASGGGRNGTYLGTVTKNQGDACARDSGTAVLFNGSSGYVSLGTSLQVPTAYSVEAWIKTTTARGGLIAGFGSSATGASSTVDRVLYLTNNGRVAFGINTASKTTLATTGVTVADGKWHHVLATVGTAGMRVYVDGDQAASASTTATGTYTGYFRVGYDNLSAWSPAPTSNYLNATLDEVAAFPSTLTAADADAHYQAGV